MAPALVVPHDLRMGEEVALVLGFVLSTLAALMRVWTKARLTRTMMLEDYFSLCAWLSFLAYIGLAIVIGSNGGDPVHKAYVRPVAVSQLSRGLVADTIAKQLSSVESTIYCPIIVLVKVSILLQYISIFVVHRGNIFHIIVHVLLWINVVFYTIDTFLVIFECNPRAKSWDDSVPGSCFSLHQLGVSSGVINVVSDFAILLLPVHKVWRLQMPWQKKWRILAVFAVGLFGCIAAVLRLVYSIELTEFSANASPEQQLVTDKKGLWGFAEIALGIIAGCMPVLPRFFHQPLFINLSNGSWSGRQSGRGSSENSRRTLRQRLFGTSLSRGRRYPTGSSKVSGSSSGKKSGGSNDSKSARKSFRGIETQNLKRASMDLSGTQFPREPSSTSITALPPFPRDERDKSLPDLPGSAESDKELRWQEMSRIEKVESSIPNNRNRLER